MLTFRPLYPQSNQTTSVNLQSVDVARIENDDWQALLKGERYTCQLVTGSASGETRDIIVNINLSGIRLLDRKSEVCLLFLVGSALTFFPPFQSTINQFDIEQILQYSYSQQQQTFSFSYLEEGRYFVTHKFISPDFFEMHQYLGSAIAIVIKLKSQLKKSSPEIASPSAASGSDRPASMPSSNNSSRESLAEPTQPAPQATPQKSHAIPIVTAKPPPPLPQAILSSSPGSGSSSALMGTTPPPPPPIIVTSGSSGSGSGSGSSSGGGMPMPASMLTGGGHSQDTLRRSSRAKSYFEKKYRLPSPLAGALPEGDEDGASPTSPGSPVSGDGDGMMMHGGHHHHHAQSGGGAAGRLTSLFVPPAPQGAETAATQAAPSTPTQPTQSGEEISEGTQEGKNTLLWQGCKWTLLWRGCREGKKKGLLLL